MTYYLVKLLNLASKHERSLENCTRQYTLKTFVSHSKKNPPSPPFFFYISPLTLSKIQGQWLCSTPLLERRFKQSLGVCFYIVIELPFDSFQEKHKESDHVSCGFESPELIIYTMLSNVYARHLSFLHPRLGKHLFPNFTWWCFEMASLSLSQEKISVALFCFYSENIIFIILACTSRRIAKYGIQSLFILKNVAAFMR